MKHLLCGLGLFAWIVSAAPLAAQQETPPLAQGPRIACDQPLFDFGTVDNSQTIEHTFVIRNTGDTTLEISNVRPACGCTLANISEKMVPPGGESHITARLSLQGRTGPQSKPITILSNDPQTPEFRVTLAGTAVSGIQVAPDRILFGQIGQGQKLEQTVEISAVSQESFNITGVQASMSELTGEVETLEQGRRYKVKATLTGPAQPGPVNATLLVNTDNQSRPVLTVPVIANVVGELIFAPSVIEVPLSAGGQPLTRYIVVRPGTLTQFELKGVTLPDPAMRSSVFPFGDQGYRIQIENIVATPELNGKTIRIETSGEQMAVIEIPLRVQ